MPDDATERKILLAAAEHPDAPPADVADAADADPETVRDVLARTDVDEEVESVAETDWTDPDRCPFCGGALSDPGAGFMDHLDGSPDCATRFDQWREAIAGDVGSEWGG